MIPMPTRSVMRGGLRPCWIATMETRIIGPIADSNSVICTTLNSGHGGYLAHFLDGTDVEQMASRIQELLARRSD